MSSVEKVDLNLFRLLEALYEERSATRAAERLFITPSAVSHSLRRLRRMLNDELFTRGPHGMVPTPRAHEVARQLRVLLPQLGEIVSPLEFNPIKSDRHFRVACFPYLVTTLMPEIAADLAKTAPGVHLDVKLLYDTVVDDLDGGGLDAALGHFRRVPPRLIAEELFQDRYVVVLPANHPAATRRLTLKALARIPYIDISIENQADNSPVGFDMRQGLERLVVQSGIAAAEEALLKAGLQRVVRGRMPDSVSAMAMAARTDAISLVPETAARRFAKHFGLVVREAPFAIPPLAIQMLTHARFGEKTATRWLRSRIRHVISG